MSVIHKYYDGSSKNILDFLSPQQMRHITILHTMIELVKERDRMSKEDDADGACGISNGINAVSKMLGCQRAHMITHREPPRLNPNLFEEQPLNMEDQEDFYRQNIVYRSALATSQWHLEKLLEN